MERSPRAYSPAPRRPNLRLPPGSWDAHCHIFGPAGVYPFAETRSFTPADAPQADLFAMHQRVGISHSVVVQSGCHGFDHRAVEAALASGDTPRRAVALLPTDADDAEIRRLSGLGFCGVRFNYMRHLGAGTPPEDVIAFTHRLADHGWHLQMHIDGSRFADMVPLLRRSATTVVIDHMGRVDAGAGLDQPAFVALLRLSEDPRFWVKVSGCERASRQGPPYDDAVPFARRLVEEFGDRALWGTDWPHPHMDHAIPDDGTLVDLLARIVADEAGLHRLLVDNPTRLYELPPKAAHSGGSTSAIQHKGD